MCKEVEQPGVKDNFLLSLQFFLSEKDYPKLYKGLGEVGEKLGGLSGLKDLDLVVATPKDLESVELELELMREAKVGQVLERVMENMEFSKEKIAVNMLVVAAASLCGKGELGSRDAAMMIVGMRNNIIRAGLDRCDNIGRNL